MKKSTFFSILCLMSLCFACKKDGNTQQEEAYTGKRENTTIQLLSWHYASNTTSTTIDNDWVIKATVTANDKSGNMKNMLYVQDPSGGIRIAIEAADLSSTYQIGQQLYLQLKGLAIVNKQGTMEIGFAESGNHKIPDAKFKERVFLYKAPDTTTVIPTTTTAESLSDDQINTLIYLKGITLQNGGKHNFVSDNITTAEPIINTTAAISLVTEPTANFASDKLPTGKGDIIGILTKSDAQWQIHLRDIKDVKAFDGIATEVLEPNQAK